MPDTFKYFVAGYVIAGVLYGGYLLSLWRRGRREESGAKREERR